MEVWGPQIPSYPSSVTQQSTNPSHRARWERNSTRRAHLKSPLKRAGQQRLTQTYIFSNAKYFTNSCNSSVQILHLSMDLIYDFSANFWKRPNVSDGSILDLLLVAEAFFLSLLFFKDILLHLECWENWKYYKLFCLDLTETFRLSLLLPKYWHQQFL